MVREGVIQVHLPHVVSEEWRTQHLEHLRKQFQKAHAALSDLIAGGHLRGHSKFKALELAESVVASAASDVEHMSHQSLGELLDTLRATLLGVADDHGSRVIRAYFSGSTPFSGLKSRKDFPDAFAFEAIVDLKAAMPDGDLVVVTADKAFAAQLRALGNVSMVETLEALVESDRVEALTAEVALEARWRRELPSVIVAAQENQSDIPGQAFIASFIQKLVHHPVMHPSIPSDNNEAVVTMIDDPEDVAIDFMNAENYGPGVLRIPFSCTSHVLLDFPIYHSDAYSQIDNVSIQWGDHENDKYFDAQAHATAHVEGYLILILKDWTDEEPAESMSGTVDEISSVVLLEDEIGNALT